MIIIIIIAYVGGAVASGDIDGGEGFVARQLFSDDYRSQEVYNL